MTQMRVCDVCSRHVFASEKVCPFCNAELGEAPQRTMSQRLRKGMSRAQLLAVAAAVSGQTLAGCSEESMSIPVYGAPVEPTGGSSGVNGGGATGGVGGGVGGTAGTTSGTGGGGTSGIGVSGGVGGAGNGGEAGFGQAVYGAPVVDAGIDDAAVDDAGDDSGEPMITPLYGASPPEP